MRDAAVREANARHPVLVLASWPSVLDRATSALIVFHALADVLRISVIHRAKFRLAWARRVILGQRDGEQQRVEQYDDEQDQLRRHTESFLYFGIRANTRSG
jgi:hypothetical protein